MPLLGDMFCVLRLFDGFGVCLYEAMIDLMDNYLVLLYYLTIGFSCSYRELWKVQLSGVTIYSW